MDVLLYFGAILGILGILGAAYLLVRVGSIAYYRTRAEYDDRRRVRDFLINNNGDSDAKG